MCRPPYYPRYISWTETSPPLVYVIGGQLSKPSEVDQTDEVGRGSVARRVPVMVHQGDRIPHLYLSVMTASLETWDRQVVAAATHQVLADAVTLDTSERDVGLLSSGNWTII